MSSWLATLTADGEQFARDIAPALDMLSAAPGRGS
jgi:hypothetical protein